jgi:hypothetical protein
MKFKNLSAVHTPDLRRFIEAGLVARGVDPDRYDVMVKGGWRVHGKAGVGIPWLRLYIPRPPLTLTFALWWASQVRWLALVLEHEIDHTLGLRHKEMLKGDEFWNQPLPAWAVGLTLGPKPKRTAKPKEPLVLRRYHHAQVKLNTWVRRAKLAANRVKRWRRRVGYYERITLRAAVREPQVK